MWRGVPTICRSVRHRTVPCFGSCSIFLSLRLFHSRLHCRISHSQYLPHTSRYLPGLISSFTWLPWAFPSESCSFRRRSSPPRSLGSRLKTSLLTPSVGVQSGLVVMVGAHRRPSPIIPSTLGFPRRLRTLLMVCCYASRYSVYQ